MFLSVNGVKRHYAKEHGEVDKNLTYWSCVQTEDLTEEELQIIDEKIRRSLDAGTTAGPKVYSCTECEKVYVTALGLKRHMHVHRGDAPANFTCSDCGKGFFTAADLVKHSRTHIGDRPFTCTQCGKGFTQESSLKVTYTFISVFSFLYVECLNIEPSLLQSTCICTVFNKLNML